jgi:phenylacetate-CoA ligase
MRESLLTRARWSGYVALNAPLEGRFPSRSRAAIERVQRRRLRRTLAHAYEHVPHYRELMRGAGLRPGDLRTASDLQRLPLIERQDLQRDPERFVSRSQPRERLVELSSAGTAGIPVTVLHDRFSLFQGAGHRQRQLAVAMALAGRRLRFRHLTIRPEGGGGDRVRTAFNSASLLASSIRGPNAHVSLYNSLERNVESINDFRPDILSSFGSYIEALFLHLHRSNAAFHRPRVVTYHSDAVSEPVRRLIMGDFGIPVLGFYGSIEAFHLGFECERHRGFHLNDDLYPIRVVDPDGATLPDGEVGEVVVSNLVTRGTILLNYRLGDLAARVPEACPCGRGLPLLTFLQGRKGHRVESRTPILVLRSLVAGEPGIWRFQIAEQAAGRFTVTVVPMEGCDREATAQRLVAGLGEHFGPAATVDVTFVEDLPRTRAGKVPEVVARPPDA